MGRISLQTNRPNWQSAVDLFPIIFSVILFVISVRHGLHPVDHNTENFLLPDFRYDLTEHGIWRKPRAVYQEESIDLIPERKSIRNGQDRRGVEEDYIERLLGGFQE